MIFEYEKYEIITKSKSWHPGLKDKIQYIFICEHVPRCGESVTMYVSEETFNRFDIKDMFQLTLLKLIPTKI
jgi:hypothetical protein